MFTSQSQHVIAEGPMYGHVLKRWKRWQAIVSDKTHTFTEQCWDTHTEACMYVCIYVCMYIYIYICIYVYI
jgi:hypothetical protein